MPMVKCEKCALLFKKAGLLRRHLKAEHGIFKNAFPVNQDDAKKFEQSLKCDQCEHIAATRGELIEHLEEKIAERKFKCAKCGMRAHKKHKQLCYEIKKTLTLQILDSEAPKYRYKSK